MSKFLQYLNETTTAGALDTTLPGVPWFQSNLPFDWPGVLGFVYNKLVFKDSEYSDIILQALLQTMQKHGLYSKDIQNIDFEAVNKFVNTETFSDEITKKLGYKDPPLTY